jgi:hypothetical protein
MMQRPEFYRYWDNRQAHTVLVLENTELSSYTSRIFYIVKQLTISALYIHTAYYTMRIAISGGRITTYFGYITNQSSLALYHTPLYQRKCKGGPSATSPGPGPVSLALFITTILLGQPSPLGMDVYAYTPSLAVLLSTGF